MFLQKAGTYVPATRGRTTEDSTLLGVPVKPTDKLKPSEARNSSKHVQT